MQEVDILILGLGWQGLFVKTHFESKGLKSVATSTSGKPDTIPFKFDPTTFSLAAYESLPPAKLVLVTFPLPTPESPEILMESYRRATNTSSPFILLGSTRPWHGEPGNPWADRTGPIREDNRFLIEKLFIARGGCVLNLAGLYGGTRHPKNWIEKVCPSKDALQLKSSLHLIHGEDVARVVYAVSQKFSSTRWIVTDLRVYDWWEIVAGYDTERAVWVRELLDEEGVKALPRPSEMLKRCLDSRDVWNEFGLMPTKSLYTVAPML